MKTLISILILLFSFCLLEQKIYAQNAIVVQQQYFENAYVTDLNLALNLSKETKQNVVLIFSADWCAYCQTLKKDLPYIKEFDNKIICILDVDKERKLSRKFNAKTLPTSIVLNPNGEELSRLSGYNKIQYSKWLSDK